MSFKRVGDDPTALRVQKVRRLVKTFFFSNQIPLGTNL